MPVILSHHTDTVYNDVRCKTNFHQPYITKYCREGKTSGHCHTNPSFRSGCLATCGECPGKLYILTYILINVIKCCYTVCRITPWFSPVFYIVKSHHTFIKIADVVDDVKGTKTNVFEI